MYRKYVISYFLKNIMYLKHHNTLHRILLLYYVYIYYVLKFCEMKFVGEGFVPRNAYIAQKKCAFHDIEE